VPNDRGFGGNRRVYICTREMEFISVHTPAQKNEFYCCKEDVRLNIAGQKNTLDLLALTELTIGNKLTYCLHRNLMNICTNTNTCRLNDKEKCT
jgi:hypothetical protein